MKLLTPRARAIGRPEGPARDDAVDLARAEGTPDALKNDLIQLIGKGQVLHRISDLVRYASDASPYRYLPQVVVRPRTVDDVRAILKYCVRTGRHATFRAGGTSLNGQSQSDDVLIDVRRHWAGMVVEDDGARLRARPGTILGQADAVLRRIGRRLGPDPASIDVATIGGVIANNAGGMRCTLERNAYHTVSSLTLVLASGTVIGTATPGAEAKFAAAEPKLAAGLLQLRSELQADTELAQRVRHKFTIRNTNGYALSALLDADTPLEIFRRLIVGSEGTLAFMAEAVIDTIAAPAMTTVAWIPLPSIGEAVVLVPGLVALGAEAVELMLAPALAAAEQFFPGTPGYWRTLDPKAAALLVEFGADNPAGLDAAEASAAKVVTGANLLHPLEFTRDTEQIALYWHVRDGLLGIVGHQRPEGTALVIEDVCFPPARIAEGAQDLQDLLSKHGFMPNAAGHAAYGNLHFTLTPRLADPADRQKYAAFMTDLVALIIDKYDGSLKAEHGTGINMAPFLSREWGEKATGMMWRIKELADPHGVLGPNVILTRDDGINLKSFKSSPAIEDVAVHCIECGFCEAVCPSRNVTATPRHRSLPLTLVELSARAGKPLWIPGDVAGKCCSTPWSSKGYIRGHKWMAATTCDALWEWSRHGTLPVVIDAASCTNGLLDDVKNYLDDEHRARLDQITLLDSIAWCDQLVPALTITRRVGRAAVHPTCSSTHLGLSKTLESLAGRLADEVLVPIGTTCCGTAGDRGLLHPELVISATRDEKAGLDQTPADAYLSANRTCEMGLRQATGHPYESFIFLLEELTRPT